MRHSHRHGHGFHDHPEACGHRRGPHRRGPGHRGGPGREGRHGRRPLGHGELKYLLLGLIAEAPRHGYDLITEIETRTGGAYKPSPGVLYPALEMMQDMGWIRAVETDGKRVMQVTDTGTAGAAEHAGTIAGINARLAELAAASEAGTPDDVRMEMRRLRHAVKTLLMSDKADARAIAERIAAARAQIEQL